MVNFLTMSENLTVTGTIGVGNVNCYNATGVITVAGNGTTFTVENGGSATFIAGVKILYLPGTTVQAGGYMHGYITLTNEYCASLLPNPVVSNPVMTGEKKSSVPEMAVKGQQVVAYPNPARGTFTLELRGSSESVMTNVEIYSLNGLRVMTQPLAGELKHVFSVEGLNPGVYFIHVTTTSGPETVKLVKL
jgi:hypothetical protein